MSDGFLPVGEASTFQQVMPRSFAMAQPPRFAFGTWPGEVASLFYGSQNLGAVGVYVGERFELSDGFILHRDGRLLVSGDLKLFPKHVTDIAVPREAAFAARPRRRVAGKVAQVISAGHLIYGHWLAEILPRLGVLEAAGYAIETLTFPVPADTPAFGLELLRLCGVPESRILRYEADEVLCADELLLVTLMHNGIRYSPLLERAVALFKRGVTKAGHSLVARHAPARIFLARGRGNRKLHNRDAIEKMAQDAGFVLVRPETLSLPEQFALFAGAREIAGEYGSAFHTALFSPAGTIVCGLRGHEGHPGFLQSGIGDVLGHHTGYVFGQSNDSAAAHDYTVPEGAFADCLRGVFSAGSDLGPRMVPAREVVVEAVPVAKRRGFWPLRRAGVVSGGYESLFGGR